jgi:hypothetical protein
MQYLNQMSKLSKKNPGKIISFLQQSKITVKMKSIKDQCQTGRGLSTSQHLNPKDSEYFPETVEGQQKHTK